MSAHVCAVCLVHANGGRKALERDGWRIREAGELGSEHRMAVCPGCRPLVDRRKS